MADTYTAFLNLTKPEVGASRDTWGDKFNANFTLLDTWAKNTDATVKANATAAADLANTKVAKVGDTMTGALRLDAGTLRLGKEGTANAALVDTWMVRHFTNGNLYFQPGDGSNTYAIIDRAGNIWTPKFNDLKTYIDTADAAEVTARTNADALKFDKAGGNITGAVNVTGAVTASGTVLGNSLVATWAGDSIVQLESTAAPMTSYRRKQIYSSNNVGGGNNWLFRAIRPSDGAVQDWTLANGTGGTIWTTGNFDPATKVNKAGDTMTGWLTAPGFTATGAGAGYNINTRDNGVSFLIYNSTSRLRFYNGTADVFSVGYDGTVSTLQLGDLNTRIETRAAAFADDRAQYRVLKAGDTMTGNLQVSKAYPAYNYYWSGILNAGWLLDSDARIKWRNNDTGGVYFSVGTGGDLWSSQLGDVKSYIDATGSNAQSAAQNARVHAAQWVFAGDLPLSYQSGGMTGAYGGYAMMCDRWSYDPTGGGWYVLHQIRYRYLQLISNNAGAWTIGAAS